MRGLSRLRGFRFRTRDGFFIKRPRITIRGRRLNADSSFLNLSDLQNILQTISDIIQEPDFSLLPDKITDLKARAAESMENSYQFQFPIDMLNMTDGDLQSERSSVTLPAEGMLDGT